MRWAIVGLFVACAPTVSPGPAPAPAPAPALASASASASAFASAPAAALPPAPPPRNFTAAGFVTFTAGAPLKEKRIAKQKTWAGSTPDGTVSIVGYDMKGWVQTPKATFPFPAAHVARTVFTTDLSRVAVLQYLGAAAILDVSTGKVVLQRTGPLECDARFVGNDMLWVHEESKDKDAKLMRVDLKTGATTPMTKGRRVDRCASSADAKTWILFDEYAKDSRLMLLSQSGQLTPLAHDNLDQVTLSPNGERVCFVRDLKVLCIRTDRTEERIASDISVNNLEIDPSGARMLIQAQYSVKDQPRQVTLLADFASGTVREIRGPSLKSGGSVHLMAGGKVIATGAGNGVEAFDVEAGRRHSLTHNQMYSVHALLGAERSVIGEEDNGGDTFLISLP